MFEYEMQQLRTADLMRRADHERRVRETARARREAPRDTAEHESHSRRFRRRRFARAA